MFHRLPTQKRLKQKVGGRPTGRFMFLGSEVSHDMEEDLSRARDTLKTTEKHMCAKAPFTLMTSRRRKVN